MNDIQLRKARQYQKNAARKAEFARDTLAAFWDTGASAHWWQYLDEHYHAEHLYRAARVVMGIEPYRGAPQ